MTGKQIFWGVALISFGILLLFHNTFDFVFQLDDLWKYWPLVFIFWGVSMIIKNDLARKVLIGLTALVLSLAIYASIYGTIDFFRDNIHNIEISDEDWDSTDTNNYSFDYKENYSKGVLNFEGGAAGITLKDSTDKLINILTSGIKNNYDVTKKEGGNTVYVSLDMKRTKIKKDHKNRVNIELNNKVNWDMTLDFGASAADLDLSNFLVEKLNINSGASSLKVKLGSKSNNSDVKIDAGAAAIELYIPDDVGCELKADVSLSSKEFHGFNQVHGDTFRTDNFDTAKKKIIIDLDAGVSSIKIDRYGSDEVSF